MANVAALMTEGYSGCHSRWIKSASFLQAPSKGPMNANHRQAQSTCSVSVLYTHSDHHHLHHYHYSSLSLQEIFLWSREPLKLALPTHTLCSSHNLFHTHTHTLNHSVRPKSFRAFSRSVQFHVPKENKTNTAISVVESHPPLAYTRNVIGRNRYACSGLPEIRKTRGSWAGAFVLNGWLGVSGARSGAGRGKSTHEFASIRRTHTNTRGIFKPVLYRVVV